LKLLDDSMRLLVLFPDCAQFAAVFMAVIALESIRALVLMALRISRNRFLMYAFSWAKSTQCFSLVKVIQLYFCQKCSELLDVRVILLNQRRVLIESGTDLLVLNLAFVVLVVATGHFLVAKEARHFQPLALDFQVLLKLKIVHLLFAAIPAIEKVLFAHFQMLLQL